jgi:hypothetical protein
MMAVSVAFRREAHRRHRRGKPNSHARQKNACNDQWPCGGSEAMRRNAVHDNSPEEYVKKASRAAVREAVQSD